jgi:hypothetical protein
MTDTADGTLTTGDRRPPPVAHTPGPWRYQEGADKYTHIVRAGENRFVCQQPQNDEGRANARLIAAAPDLLAALQEMVDCYESAAAKSGCQCAQCQTQRRAHAAIKKALGDRSEAQPPHVNP